MTAAELREALADAKARLKLAQEDVRRLRDQYVCVVCGQVFSRVPGEYIRTDLPMCSWECHQSRQNAKQRERNAAKRQAK